MTPDGSALARDNTCRVEVCQRCFLFLARSVDGRRPGDFNGDGVVNLNDWTEFNAAFVDPTLAALTCDIDVNGTVTGNDYDLFGQLWEESSATDADEVRLGYAGYVRDPITGLLLARNRWYDANIGRWITRDPAGYVDGLSLYLYARGNPFGLVDPMGLLTFAEWLTVGWEGLKGGGEGIANMAKGGAHFVSETAKTAYDVIGNTVEVGGELTGTFDYRHDNASQLMRSVEHPGSWGETMSTGLKIGGRMAASAGTLGAYDIAEGVYDYSQTGDAEALSQTMGGVFTSNVIAAGAAKLAQGPKSSASSGTRVAGEVSEAASKEPLVGALEDWEGGRPSAADRLEARTAEWDAQNAGNIHGNSRNSPKTAFLYALYHQDGTFLKWGVTQDLDGRYSKRFMQDKTLLRVSEGPRDEMLRLERDRVESDPGPLNRERWAGKRKAQQ